MAKARGKPFKKGKDWNGNKAGRPQLPAEIKADRAINKFQHDRALNHVAFLPMDQLTALSKSKKDDPAFLVGAAKMFHKFAKYGDVFVYHAIMDRMVGRAPQAPPIDPIPLPPGRDVTPEPKRTFTEFCLQAKYPAPYPKQVEMFDFSVSSKDPRMLLGARGTGKTDYVTILGRAYRIYLDPTWRSLIISKSKTRNTAMLAEIAKALEANGVVLEKQNSSCIRVAGLEGKDHSVEVLTIKSSMRGRHPDEVLMDDPVTEEDVSEATRRLVESKYNEVHKLCSNICIVGQPAHLHDLYGKLRALLKLMEVPHGMIPELDHDLEAQRLAGVDEKSIQASYFLKIISDGSAPFEKINYIDRYPVGDSVAFLDPSHKGEDFTALSSIRQHFQGVAVKGRVWKKAWNHCLEEIVAELKATGVKKLCVETNGLGDQPVIMLRQLLQGLGIGVVGKDSVLNKHAKIMAAGAYAHLIHLSKESDRLYTDQVVQYEYKAKNDDGPDSLASCLEWIGLIRGKT